MIKESLLKIHKNVLLSFPNIIIKKSETNFVSHHITK